MSEVEISADVRVDVKSVCGAVRTASCAIIDFLWRGYSERATVELEIESICRRRYS